MLIVFTAPRSLSGDRTVYRCWPSAQGSRYVRLPRTEPSTTILCPDTASRLLRSTRDAASPALYTTTF